METAHRILVPLDGSTLAEAAIPWADAWAEALMAEVELLRVVSPPESGIAVDRRAQMETRQSARAGLEVAAHRFTHARSVSCHVLAGPAAGTIVAHAHAARSTLIVMGTHGHSGLARVLLGSVANAVIRSADVPVLAIRPDLAVPPAVPTRVLLPLDGTERSAEIVRRSLPLASSLHWTAVLYWVAGSPEQTSLIPTGVLAVSKTLGQKGIQTEIRTGSGDPARAISAFVTESHCQLIAMNTRGESRSGGLAPGTTERVVYGTPVPVLVLRSRRSLVRSVARPSEEAEGVAVHFETGIAGKTYP